MIIYNSNGLKHVSTIPYYYFYLLGLSLIRASSANILSGAMKSNTHYHMPDWEHNLHIFHRRKNERQYEGVVMIGLSD